MKLKKILILVAHPDDEIIGCGGTLAKYAQQKDSVQCVFYCDGESSRKNFSTKDILQRKNQALKTSKLLKIKKPIFLNLKDNQLDDYPLLEIIQMTEKIIYEYKPDIIYTHFNGDLNIDHQIISRAVVTASRPVLKKNIKKIYMMEILSSSDLMLDEKYSFYPNSYVDISNFISMKKKCLNIYKKEMMTFPKIRSIKSIINLNAYRGSQISRKYAEAFKLIREIQN